MLKLLGLDPGTKNWGYAVVEVLGENWKLCDAGMLQRPLNSFGAPFKDLDGKSAGQQALDAMRRTSTELAEVIGYWRIQVAVIERMISLGQRSGNLNELVTCAVGMVVEQAYRMQLADVVTLTSATWKKAVEAGTGVPADDFHKYITGQGRGKARQPGFFEARYAPYLGEKQARSLAKTAVHPFDAAVMALFHAGARLGGRRLDFLGSRRNLEVVAEEVCRCAARNAGVR